MGKNKKVLTVARVASQLKNRTGGPNVYGALDHARKATLVVGRSPGQDTRSDGRAAAHQHLGLEGNAVPRGADGGPAVVAQRREQRIQRARKRAFVVAGGGEAG